MTEDARRSAEQAARGSYGRLVAYLAARSRDVAAAEDALAEAFRAALETWPERGIPDRPEAWLLTVARRTMIHAGRRAALHGHAVEALRHLGEAETEMPDLAERDVFPDERLKLMFVCAHPAIDPSAHAANAAGRAGPRCGADRLGVSRFAGHAEPASGACEEQDPRRAGIAFSVPGRDELPDRLDAVLAAIYAAYGSGWDDASGADPKRKGLALEALDLARVLVALLPNEPEPAGLLALMLYCEARQAARRDREGRFVPLSEQDVKLWNGAMIDEARDFFPAPRRWAGPGHSRLRRRSSPCTQGGALRATANAAALAMLYDVWLETTPTLGVLVGRAAALGDHAGAATGLAALDQLPEVAIAEYQPAWALRAHLLAGLGDRAGARGWSTSPVPRAAGGRPGGAVPAAGRSGSMVRAVRRPPDCL